MDEVFPVLAGIVLGLVLQPLRSARARGVALAIGGPVLGAVASWISGELAVSWVYALIDAVQVLAVAILTVLAVGAWRRRGLRRVA